MSTCVSHHHACECREAEFQSRVKELLDSKKLEFECFQKVNSALTDARIENARLRKVVDAAREYVMGGGSQRVRDALREVDNA